MLQHSANKMNVTYQPIFCKESNDIQESIAKLNKQEKDKMTAMDLSRLTSSWFQSVVVYVELCKEKDNLSTHLMAFDEYRDNTSVPTTNLY